MTMGAVVVFSALTFGQLSSLILLICFRRILLVLLFIEIISGFNSTNYPAVVQRPEYKQNIAYYSARKNNANRKGRYHLYQN